MKNASGMTLIEVLAALLVLTLLVTAMGTGMELALQSYGKMRFASESQVLEDILCTALRDALSFGENFRWEGDALYFTSREFGLTEGCVTTEDGKIVLLGERSIPLISPAAYGSLEIRDLTLTQPRNGLICITFRITDGEAQRPVRTMVRPLNRQK